MLADAHILKDIMPQGRPGIFCTQRIHNTDPLMRVKLLSNHEVTVPLIMIAHVFFLDKYIY